MMGSRYTANACRASTARISQPKSSTPVINMHRAKTELCKLVEAAERGEEVIISRNGKPAVQLVPVAPKTVRLGTLAGKVTIPEDDDWWQPMSDEEVEQFLSGDLR
jgi:prevent-host-death family protein